MVTFLAFGFIFLGWVGFLPVPLLGGGAYFDPLFSEKVDPSLLGTFHWYTPWSNRWSWQVSKGGD